MSDKEVNEQIGGIIRGVLGDILGLMAEETQKKLLGFPRYEKRKFEDRSREVGGFIYTWAIIYESDAYSQGRNVIALFRDEEICDQVLEWLNTKIR